MPKLEKQSNPRPAVVEVWENIENVNELIKYGYKLTFVNPVVINSEYVCTQYILELKNKFV